MLGLCSTLWQDIMIKCLLTPVNCAHTFRYSQNFCIHFLWGKAENPPEDKKSEGPRLWCFVVSGRLPVALPPVGPASPQAVCQSVCSFAYATEFSLAYPFPSLRSQILVFSPGESLPKLTFVFLFSCRIFNMSQTACKRSINVTFRIACWKSCICCPSGPWSWSFWLSHDSDLMCHCDLQWQYLAPRFKCLLKLLLECC